MLDIKYRLDARSTLVAGECKTLLRSYCVEIKRIYVSFVTYNEYSTPKLGDMVLEMDRQTYIKFISIIFKTLPEFHHKTSVETYNVSITNCLHLYLSLENMNTPFRITNDRSTNA